MVAGAGSADGWRGRTAALENDTIQQWAVVSGQSSVIGTDD